jgi:hypothetical protein
MTQFMNQFAQTPEKGQLDQHPQPALIPCAVDSSQSTPLVPGQAVTIVDSAGGVPKVIAAATDTSDVWGFVPYDARKTSYAAGDYVEIAAFRGNVLYLEASAAIARGAQVMLVIAGSKVATAAGAGKRVVGRALDKATANGDLIRVYVDLPGTTLP